MKRPAFCPKEDHNKEELKYFCKDCETPVCQICVTIEHGGHNIKLIKEEAERQKTEIKSFIGVHQIEPTDCDPELVAHFVFVENYKLFNTVKTEQIGTLKKPTKAGHCDIEGKGLEEGIALREAHFTLTTMDTEGRQCYDERL